LGWKDAFDVGTRQRSVAAAALMGETLPTLPFLELITIIVPDYDPAIRFFVDALGFALIEDTPSVTNDGRAKRWVVVRPPSCRDRDPARTRRR